MIAHFLRRMLWSIPVLLSVGIITFTIARATPGGPFDASPNQRQLSPGAEKVLRAKFGMDLPMWRQFTRYMFFDIEIDVKTKQPKFVWGALGGNLGPTYTSRGAETVQHYLFSSTKSRPSRFYYSARLGFQALLFALLLGVPLGLLAALKQNTWIDYITLLISTTLVGIPAFILALLLIIVFAAGLNWVTVIPDWDDPIRPWVLPTLSLGFGSLAYIARLTRSSVLEI
jgi:oligopeptide transport system permease protein